MPKVEDWWTGQYGWSGTDFLTDGKELKKDGNGYWFYYHYNNANYVPEVVHEASEGNTNDHFIYGNWWFEKTDNNIYGDYRKTTVDGNYKDLKVPFTTLGYDYNYSNGWRSLGNHKYIFLGDKQKDPGGYAPVSTHIVWFAATSDMEGGSIGLVYKALHKITDDERNEIINLIKTNET